MILRIFRISILTLTRACGTFGRDPPGLCPGVVGKFGRRCFVDEVVAAEAEDGEAVEEGGDSLGWTGAPLLPGDPVN